jgi:hypothetical protein
MLMDIREILSLRMTLAAEFDNREQRSDGVRVIESLCGGLTLIRDAVYARVHADVERRIGLDSMIFPLSEEKTERNAKQEIEIYQVVVAAETATVLSYVSNGIWFRDWLAQLRLGNVESNGRIALRIGYYVSKSVNDQRLAFGNILSAALPEASRAPLILLRLLPAAIDIATSVAFQKSADAERFRRDQSDILPSIADCHHCRGKVLDNGEQCATCGNPIWIYEWLTSADG